MEQELVLSGLFGRGLIPVEGVLVERYNACLQDMGMAKTALASFNVDGWGWSPEVADERNDPYYLSHGIANPFAIIVSPEQYRKPVYFSFHSFDRLLMQKVFEWARTQIADLTTQSAIWLDIDNEIANYTSPEDLLMNDSIVVRFSTPGRMMRAAREQRQLVRRFTESPNAWSDDALRAQIIASAAQDGDLRFRSLIIPDMTFSDIRSFYCRAFDGVFVFRDIAHKDYVMILESGEMLSAVGRRKNQILHIDDPQVLSVLLAEGLAEIRIEWLQENIPYLKRVLEYLFVEAFSAAYGHESLGECNSAKQKACLKQFKAEGKLPEAYEELERLVKRLNRQEVRSLERMSDALQAMLAQPCATLPEHVREVVWRLLVRLSPLDVLNLYAYDKKHFFKCYQSWPESKKMWAVAFLKKAYVPKHQQPQPAETTVLTA